MFGHIKAGRGPRSFALATLTALSTAALVALPTSSADLRPDYQPAAYAITGATVVAGPGRTIAPGTVVVRDGRVEAVGPTDQVQVPYDAEVIDGKGLFIYPGFVDLFTTLGQPAGVVRSKTGAGRTVPYADFALARTPPDNRNGITPEFQVGEVLDLPDSTAEERRGLGFTDLLAAPGGAIATGQSALVGLSSLPRRESVVKTPVALHINLRPPFEPPPPPLPTDDPAPARRRVQGPQLAYPTALMGVIAHLRQAMLDADYQHQLQTSESIGARPATDPALDVLQRARTRALAVWWEANTVDEIHRVLDLAEEFGTTAVVVGGREAGKVADRLKALDVPVVLRVDYPDEPKVPSEADYRKGKAEDRYEPRAVLVDRGARWKERVGTAGELHKAGVRFAFATDGLTKSETFHAQVRKAIAAGLPRDAAVDALTRRAAEIAGASALGAIEPGKLGHLVALSAPYGEEKAKPRYVFADGLKFDLEKDAAGAARRKRRGDESAKDEPKDKELKDEPKEKAVEKTKPIDPPAKAEVDAAKVKAQDATVAPPKGEEDQGPSTPFVDLATEFEAQRKPAIKTGGDAFIKDVTILTVTKGTIAKGSILVVDGKIKEVGPDAKPLPNSTVIDATGLVAMPGIIDTHSHMAIQGGVNEATLSIVPEVRVRDVVTKDDPTIYQAAAGGTTAARLLHGSANTIGGQDAVIKLKAGPPGRELLLKGNPQGVKFALGENVTRRAGRFPNTRMGVEATIERAFDEARAYKRTWQAYEAAKGTGKGTIPPRRDLRLEALAGIVDGSIRIHSHCYRSDEILMLLRLAERNGIRVRSLQHVLEGYKVAAEIAAHGASASTFSDWWAYKVEAYDAIPFNAALLTRAGVSTVIKSDSEELVRHLNLEAAKMVRYGGVSESEALAFVTINPARELGIDDRMGSIEVGKDADISIFNAHPLDAFSRCQYTLIDGEVWFQRKEADGKATPRPGDHTTMPTAPAEAVAKVVNIAENPAGSYALVGATIHPVVGPEIKGGVVIVSGGKIAGVGGSELAIPAGAATVDLQGLDVWPGMVDSGSPIGLTEIGSLAETQDYADSAQFQPELRTSTALHPDSELIPVTRAAGVLSIYVQPSGGSIAGQGCVIALDGWVPPEMVIRDRAALNVNIPTYISVVPGAPRRFGIGGGPDTDPNARRKERLGAIKEQFRKALAYDKVRAEAASRKVDAPSPDPRLEALAPYAKGEKLVLFRANDRAEILDALAIAAELKLKAAITGGAEAWRVSAELKAADVPVLVAGTLINPIRATDPYDAPYSNAAKLKAAGVTFALRSLGHGPDQATSSRNLPFEAATAVAFGLKEDEAVEAVTIAPAKILGVADRVGSIEVGKRADLVITAGHLLRPTSTIKALFVGGKPLPPESKHTELFAKYGRRLDAVRAGTAPLGLDRPAGAIPANATAPQTGPAAGR